MDGSGCPPAVRHRLTGKIVGEAYPGEVSLAMGESPSTASGSLRGRTPAAQPVSNNGELSGWRHHRAYDYIDNGLPIRSLAPSTESSFLLAQAPALVVDPRT
jgi:hypothetical protein